MSVLLTVLYLCYKSSFITFSGDAYAISTSIHKKYRNMIDKEFFQVYAAQSRKVKDNRNMIEKKYGLNAPVYDILVKN